MHGIVSLLDPPHQNIVEEIWHTLTHDCGLPGMQHTPFVHVSWQIGEDYDWLMLDRMLADLAGLIEPFPVRVTGLGVFTGKIPVLYLPVVRSKRMTEVHSLVWDRIGPFGQSVSHYYSPEAWMPHITLSMEGLTGAMLGKAMDHFTSRRMDWQFWITNLAMLQQPAGTSAQIRKRFDLLGLSR